MGSSFFLYGLLPLIAFAIVDALSSDVKRAVLLAVLCSVVEMLAVLYSTGKLDPISIIATLLFIILGFISIRVNNRLYFKLQPAIVCLIAAGFIGYLQFFGQPVVYRYLPLLKQSSPEILLPYLDNSSFLETLSSLFDWMIIAIVLEGIWITYAAIKCRQSVWLFVNAFGIWILTGAVITTRLLYIFISGTNPFIQGT